MSVVILKSNELEDYVKNKAVPGDILYAEQSAEVGKFQYVYICTASNIGECAEESQWQPIGRLAEQIVRKQFEGMTLEEKVDYLIERQIEKEILNNESLRLYI